MSSIGSTNGNYSTMLGSNIESASLTFEAFLAEQQNLTIKSAKSGLQGLLDSLDETGVFRSIANHLTQSVNAVGAANDAAVANPFGLAPQESTSPISTGARATYNSKVDAFIISLNTARAQAVSARDATDGPSGDPPVTPPERAAANLVYDVANDLISLRNAMDANPPNFSQVNNVVNQAQSARDAAWSAWNSLSASTQAERKAEALAVLQAAENILGQAKSLQAISNSSLAKIQGETPISHDLGDGFTLTTWGDSGVMSLVGPDGTGILINHDGTVDNLDGTGAGWRFSNTSTLVLGNETKVTITPGTPASVLVSRAEHHFSVTNLLPGQNPAAVTYSSEGGRAMDLAQNDGHIFLAQGNGAGSWSTSGGNALGDLITRESVATSALTNEYALDASDIVLDEEGQQMIDYLASVGYEVPDYDGDGKYNNEELATAAGVLYEVVSALQEQFGQSLLRIAQANAVMMELNAFLEKIRSQGDKNQLEKDSLSAEDKAVLANLEQRLTAALSALNAEGNQSAPSTPAPSTPAPSTPAPSTPAPSTPAPSGVESGAAYLLNQLAQFNQQGVTSPTNPPPANFTIGQPDPSSSQSSSTGTGDPLSQAFLRASRLLSGFSNHNFEIPPPPNSTGQVDGTQTQQDVTGELTPGVNGDEPVTLPTGEAAEQPEPINLTLDQLASAILTLQQQLANQGFNGVGAVAGQLPPLPQISAGLESFFRALAANPELAALGLPMGQDGQLFMGRFSQLDISTLSQQQLRDMAPALASLVGAFAAFAQFQDADLPPSVAGQPTPAGSGALPPETRFAENLRLVLQGFATLSTPGYDQSSIGQAQQDSPLPGTATPEQINAGLLLFLSSLATLGLISPSPKNESDTLGGISALQDNREQIKTITGNFYTDPDLMKRLQENLNQALQKHAELLKQAGMLFTEAQETVQSFVELIKADGLVKEIVTSDDLSDEEHDKFGDKMKELQKEWGVEWGGPPSTPAEQANLTSKVMQSGMMV